MRGTAHIAPPVVDSVPGGPRFGITDLRLRGFRSARDFSLRPGVLCALVGEAGVGKSNVLAAIRALLDDTAPQLSSDDATFGGTDAIELTARLTDGRQIELRARPPGPSQRSGPAVDAAFLPGDLRAGPLAASSRTAISRLLRESAAASGEGRSAAAATLVSVDGQAPGGAGPRISPSSVAFVHSTGGLLASAYDLLVKFHPTRALCSAHDDPLPPATACHPGIP